MKNGDIDPGTLARYLAGEATHEEETRITAWLESNPTARLDLESGELQAPVSADSFLESVFDDASVASGSSEVKLPAKSRSASRPPRVSALRTRQHTVWTWPVRMAAVLLIVAAVGAAALWTIAQRGLPSEPVWAETFSTAPGERSTVRLPDGSTVELSVATTLRIGADYGSSGRLVSLEGEAFFDVARNEELPFVIRAGESRVEVLGTAFNVESYLDDDWTEVSVTEGRVRFGADTRDVILAPGQVGRLDRYDVTPITTTEINPDDAAPWRDDVLSFEGVPLHEVATELSRWFNAEVVVADFEIADQRVDGTYVDASLDAVTRSIAEALDIAVSRDGRRVSFDRKPGQ